jgi:hypothetical protein
MQPSAVDGVMTFRRSMTTWLLMLVVALLNGTIRQLTYGPHLSELAAHQLSCVTGIATLGLLIFAMSRRWRFQSAEHAWRTGMFWAVLTILFETGLGLMRGLPSKTLLSDYAFWNGHYWGLVIIFILSAPLAIWASTKELNHGR